MNNKVHFDTHIATPSRHPNLFYTANPCKCRALPITAYDGGGRLSYWKETEEGQRDEGIGEGYVYDELGRVVAKVNYQGQASLYEYDEAGRLRSSKEPFSEERASQAYERYLEAGYFPDTESTSAGYTVEGESYREVVTRLGQRYKDKRMEESTMKRGRGATPFARMLRMGAHSSSIQAVFSSMKGNVGVPSGQSVWSEEYEYDRRGNMVGQQNGWGSIAMEYDNANRMTRRGRRSYEYDKAGNITQETLYEVAIQYTYSGDNRVRSMHANKQGVIGAGQTIEYQYDGLGRRRMSSYTNEDHRREEVRQSYEQRSVRVASEWIRIGYEADEAARTPHYMPLVAIPEGTWYRVPDSAKEAKVMMKRRYSYGQDGELTYAYSHVPQYQGGEKNLEHFGSVYYTTDVLGSVRGISNEEGTVASIYEYSAFGDLYQGDSTLSYGMAYTGKQEMRGLEGIYNYGYRDYRAVEGRFSTEDPIKDGTNWYVYVGNSPLNFVDPLGLASKSNSYSLYGPPSYATREPAPKNEEKVGWKETGGFMDDYSRQEGSTRKRHTGRDTTRESGQTAGSRVGSPVDGEIDNVGEHRVDIVEDDGSRHSVIHLDPDNSLEEDQPISKRDPIGTVEDMGDNSHIHHGVQTPDGELNDDANNIRDDKPDARPTGKKYRKPTDEETDNIWNPK